MWPEMSSRTASARHARCRLTLCRFYSLLLRERSCCFAFFFFSICSLTQALLCSNPGCPELTGHPPASASGCGARCRVKLLCQHCGSALSSFRAVEMSETGCTVPRSTSRSPAPHTLVCKSPGLSQSVLVLSAWCSVLRLPARPLQTQFQTQTWLLRSSRRPVSRPGKPAFIFSHCLRQVSQVTVKVSD